MAVGEVVNYVIELAHSKRTELLLDWLIMKMIGRSFDLVL